MLRGGGDTCRRWEMLLCGTYRQTLGDVAEGGRHADVGGWGVEGVTVNMKERK